MLHLTTLAFGFVQLAVGDWPHRVAAFVNDWPHLITHLF